MTSFGPLFTWNRSVNVSSPVSNNLVPSGKYQLPDEQYVVHYSSLQGQLRTPVHYHWDWYLMEYWHYHFQCSWYHQNPQSCHWVWLLQETSERHRLHVKWAYLILRLNTGYSISDASSEIPCCPLDMTEWPIAIVPKKRTFYLVYHPYYIPERDHEKIVLIRTVNNIIKVQYKSGSGRHPISYVFMPRACARRSASEGGDLDF